MPENEQKTDALTQQMIKADALVCTLAQVRDDLRRQADQIDAIINITAQMDDVTGASGKLAPGTDAAKRRLIGLMKKMYPELENASDEDVMAKVGGLKK